MAGLRKYKSLYSSTASSFGTGEGVTITPSSVVGLPATTIVLTFDRVDSAGTATPTKMERIKGAVSGGNFVVASGGRGYDGSTEQAHTSPVVEMVWNATDWNDAVDALANVVSATTGSLDTTKVVDLTTAQVLTNKDMSSGTNTLPITLAPKASPTFTGTVTAPIIQGASSATQFPQVEGEYDNGTQKGTYNIDWTKGDRQRITCDHTGNLTLTYSGAGKGQVLTLSIDEDSTGGSSVTLPTSKWPNGSAGTFITTASALNELIVKFDGTNYRTQLAADFK